MRKRQIFLAAVLAGGWGCERALADEVALPALKDNTLYQNAAGSQSNGMGDFFFAGRTQQGKGVDIRRGVLAFDLSAIPAGSVITSAVLHLECTQVPSGSPAHDVSLHRALADWGEGASDGAGNEGMGDGAQAGDATWLHTFYDDQFWTSVGGDFEPTASASTTVSVVGPYSWGPTTDMTADVQHWVDNPTQNFGWVLVGDESEAASAKRFNSVQSPNVSLRPRLVVNFDPPAVLIDVNPAFGLHVSGDAASIRNSDNEFYVVRSIPGFTANEPNLIDVRIGFTTLSGGPTMRITYEGRLNAPNGVVRVRLRNWMTGGLEQVDSFALGTTEITRVIEGVSTTNRIRLNDQRIEMSVRKTMLVTLTAGGFRGFFDLTRININP